LICCFLRGLHEFSSFGCVKCIQNIAALGVVRRKWLVSSYSLHVLLRQKPSLVYVIEEHRDNHK
jgi:hypothetical protein